MARKRGNDEGSIYQMSDGRWRAALSLGWKKNADGKVVLSRKIFTGKTREAVRDELTKALNDKRQGLPVVPEKQTVAQFLDHWLDHVVKNTVRPKTFRTYQDIARIHLKPGLGDIPVAKLAPQAIRTFLSEKLDSGLSPRTVKHLLVTLRSALAVAVNDGTLPRNVAALVEPPSISRPQIQTFTPQQARQFLAACEGDRLEALFAVTVALGLRQGEVLGLRWQDINFEAGTLEVSGALQRVDKKLVRVEPKTDAGRRILMLPAVTRSALAAHKRRQELDREIAEDRWRETGYVFTSTIGTPLEPRAAFGRFKELLKAAKLPDMRFHDLRHSAATLLLAQGVSARYIAEQLGHSQVSFTLQTYSHILKSVQQDVAAKMDAILAPPKSNEEESVATREEGLKRVATTVATKPS
ncbi:MAG: site-specific integrase [Bryobacterales bacterium]|nr:site-specific integrase [Bryobacterales bacterium]